MGEHPPAAILRSQVGVPRPVLVFHCVSGKNRSPVGCLALMLRCGMTWYSAMHYIAQRACADFMGFWDQQALGILYHMAAGGNAKLAHHHVDLIKNNKHF